MASEEILHKTLRNADGKPFAKYKGITNFFTTEAFELLVDEVQNDRAGHSRMYPAASQAFPRGGSKGKRAARPAAFVRRPQAILPGDGKNRPLFLPATAQKGSFYRQSGRTKSGFSPHNGRCKCCFLWITSVIFGITY